MKLTPNFDLSEFRSKDGSPFPAGVVENVEELAANLQVLRDHLKQPISINSGYRSPAHNRKVGGAPASQHLLGKAADIVVKGFTPKQVVVAIETLISLGKMKQGGLSAYATFTHYDVRGAKSRW